MVDILIGIGLIILGCIPFFILYCILASPEPYVPMTYDEEMDWLMNQHGLSHEDADEIASLPYR